MRGGFGRHRYERPQPGLQIYSYEDALYPPRAYRYHVQQATPPAMLAAAAARGGSHAGPGGSEAQITAIVLPTIDADATCGPFLKGSSGSAAGSMAGSASASSLGYLGRSASSVASASTDGMGFNPMDTERRPPPRLRAFFDCFVPDEGSSDVQTFTEVCRHAEPLNPFHYRELWAGMDGDIAVPPAPASGAVKAVAAPASAAATRTVKAEPLREEDHDNALSEGGIAALTTVKPEDGVAKAEKAKPSAAARAATRAAQNALQRTLRSLGVTDELSSMVLLAARVPPGGRLTRKQEKQLRLRPQRRPAPPRPIRRGAKVFLPARALLAGAETYGLADVGATAATGGLIDVTAAGPRVLRVANAAAHQRGAYGTVGGGGSGHHGVGHGNGYHGAGPPSHAEPTAPSVLDEFAFEDDDEEDGKIAQAHGGRRAGGKRSRGGDDDGLEEGDIPLIALGRWSQPGSPGSGGGGGSGGGPSGGGSAGANANGAAAGQLDEEAEEDSDEEDDLSAGMVEDDDDDANFSSDGGNDNDSFGGGGDDGNDDY